MSNKLQNGKQENRMLGMGYVYVLLIGSLIIPYALGYAGSLVIPDFKASNISSVWLLILGLVWLVFSFLYFILCLMKQAIIIPISQFETATGNGEKLQLIQLNVPIFWAFKKLKVLKIPRHKIKRVRLLLKAIIIQDILFAAFLLILLIIS